MRQKQVENHCVLPFRHRLPCHRWGLTSRSRTWWCSRSRSPSRWSGSDPKLVASDRKPYPGKGKSELLKEHGCIEDKHFEKTKNNYFKLVCNTRNNHAPSGPLNHVEWYWLLKFIYVIIIKNRPHNIGHSWQLVDFWCLLSIHVIRYFPK